MKQRGMVDPISLLVIIFLSLVGTYGVAELQDRHERKQLRQQQQQSVQVDPFNMDGKA